MPAPSTRPRRDGLTDSLSPGYLHPPPKLTDTPSLHCLGSTRFSSNAFVNSYWMQHAHEGCLFRCLLSLSLLRSHALCFGKEEYFQRKAPVGSFNAQREEGLVFVLHLAIVYHIAEKHFGKWRLIPCAFIDCSRSQKPALGRTCLDGGSQQGPRSARCHHQQRKLQSPGLLPHTAVDFLTPSRSPHLCLPLI